MPMLAGPMDPPDIAATPRVQAGVLRTSALAALLALVGLALVVVAGWLWHIPWLVQFGDRSAAMQFNTATGLATSGVATMLAIHGWRRLAAALGLAVAVLGGLTISQDVTGWTLGIDRLLIDPFLQAGTSALGRMSPQTALSLLVAGSWLAAQTWVGRASTRSAVYGLAGLSLVALSLFIVSGYGLGIDDAYQWHGLTRMALSSAVSFGLLGLAWLAVAGDHPPDAGGHVRPWLPLAALVAAVAVGGLVFQTLMGAERAARGRDAQARAEALAAATSRAIADHRLALDRMARRWRAGGRPAGPVWYSDAAAYLRDFPAIDWLSWIDSRESPVWAVPSLPPLEELTGVRGLLRQDGPPDDVRHGVASVRIGDTDALMVMAPIEVAGRSDGWLVARLSFAHLLDAVTGRGYPVVVRWREGTREIGRNTLADAEHLAQDVVAVPIADRADWTLAVDVATAAPAATPWLAWASFVMVGVVVATALGQVRAARLANHRLHVANDALERESLERVAAQHAVTVILESAPDALIVVGADGHIVQANARAEALFGYSRQALLTLMVEDLVPVAGRDALADLRRRYFAEPTVQSMGAGRPLAALRRDGTTFPMEASLSPVVTEGETRVIAVIRDISERQALERERLQYAAVVESADDAIITTTRDAVVTSWNRAASRLLQHEFDDARGRDLRVLIALPGTTESLPTWEAIYTGAPVTGVEATWRRRDGSGLDVSLTVSPLFDEHRDLVGASIIARDVSQQKTDERRIVAALEEKEVLLREIHHRVKNNLAVVCSLLYLQADTMVAPEAAQALLESQHRVRSMALVHEALYGSANLAAVRFDQYARNLVGHLMDAYGAGSGAVRLIDALRPLSLGIDQAVPCGLIINELLTNCMKHAWPEGREHATITLACSIADGMAVIEIADNGRGLRDAEASQVRTLGLRLVRSLANQLGGTIALPTVDHGTRTVLTFSVE